MPKSFFSQRKTDNRASLGILLDEKASKEEIYASRNQTIDHGTDSIIHTV